MLLEIMDLRLRKLVLAAPTWRRSVANPRTPSSANFAWSHSSDCAHTRVSENFRTDTALDWNSKRANAVMRNAVIRTIVVASCSKLSHSWNCPCDAHTHQHLLPISQNLATLLCSSSRQFTASASDDSVATTEGDAASVSQLYESFPVVDEASAATREFDLVDDDLEIKTQRNAEAARTGRRSKPMCYYFTQGLCTLMEEKVHTDRFSHVYPNLKVRPVDLKRVKEQPFEFYLVLDLEGMVEILEFPVILIDAKTLEVVDRFHRFVRPVIMTEERQAEYIKGKYGRWGLDRVWHDTAVPFTEVLNSFESWMESHSLYDFSKPSKLTRAAFVTCGNWDVKTKIPEQCRDSGIELKPYFNEWINLKDIYYNFYKQRAGGMLAMLKGLKIPLTGTHHVGLDDAYNIARILQRMLAHGAIVKISAKKKAGDPKAVRWTFTNRVK